MQKILGEKRKCTWGWQSRFSIMCTYKYPSQHLRLKNMWHYFCLLNIRFWRSKVKSLDVPLDPSSLCNTGTKSPPSSAPLCPEFLKLFPLFIIRMPPSPPWLHSSCLSGWFLMLLLHVAPSLGILKVGTLDDVCCRRPTPPFLLWTTAATIRGPVLDQFSTVTQSHLNLTLLSLLFWHFPAKGIHLKMKRQQVMAATAGQKVEATGEVAEQAIFWTAEAVFVL